MAWARWMAKVRRSRRLYDLSSGDFHDITTGNDGRPAGPGYDLATGLGTPIANLLVPALAGYQSTVTSPASITTVGSNSYTFSGGSISINDPAATGSSNSLSLSVADGTLTLGSTTGLTFVSGADGSSSMTVTGTEAKLNAALNGLVYTPTGAFPFAANLQDDLQVAFNDASNNQTGMARVSITVIAPPTVAVSSGTVEVQSGSNVSIPISVWDSDAAGNSDTVTLTVANGKLTLATTTGLTFNSGSNGSSSMTVTGTEQSLLIDISGLVYAAGANFTGSDPLQITAVNSLDNLSGSATVPIAVYSAPAILAPSTWYVSFGENSSSQISIFDPAASGTSDSLALSVTDGSLSFASTAGLTFTSGSNYSSSMTVNGTLANLNAALAKLYYVPTDQVSSSSDTLQLSLVDASNHTSSTFALPIAASIAAPSVEVPDDPLFGAAEDAFNVPIVFSYLRIEDPNAVGDSDSLTISATNGTIWIPPSLLSPTDDLTITAGADGSSSFALTGPVTELNGLVWDTIRYTPNPGYTGPDWLKLSLVNSDNRLSGSGVAVIEVAPGAFVYTPGNVYADENSPYTFAAGSIGMIDAGAVGDSESLNLQTYEGSLTLASTAGLTFTAGANGSSSMTVTGTLAELNAALDGLVYSPSSNFVGSSTLDIFADDSVDRGEMRTSVSIQVNPLPSLTAPSSVSLNENNSYAFSGGSINLTDSAPEAYESLSLSVSNGTLALASTNYLSFCSGANDSSSMTVMGLPSDIDAALNGLVYTPNSLYSGPDALQISDTDTFDTFTASANVPLTVYPPPVVAVTDPSGSYNGTPYAATGTVTGLNGVPGPTLEGVGLTYTYYAGTNTGGTPLPAAPTNAGTYTVVVAFAGSQDYIPGSAQTTFTIGHATPAVAVSDAGGTYTGSAFAANATVAGVNGTPGSALEGVGLTFTYDAGSTATGTPLSGVPVNAGTYTVVASFVGSTDYSAGSAQTTFTIASATPKVIATDAGGQYAGNPYPASATATGIGNATVNGTFAYSYYVGSTASGTAISTPPTSAGTYTVIATFTSGDANYSNAPSSPVTFSIGAPSPSIAVSDAGGTYNGNPYPATGTVAGLNGVPGAKLETVGLTYTYYSGSTATGTPLSGAPHQRRNVYRCRFVCGKHGLLGRHCADDVHDRNCHAESCCHRSQRPVHGKSVPGIDHGHGSRQSVAGWRVVLRLLRRQHGHRLGQHIAAPETVGTYTVVATFVTGDPNYSTASHLRLRFPVTASPATVTVSDVASTYTGNGIPGDGHGGRTQWCRRFDTRRGRPDLHLLLRGDGDRNSLGRRSCQCGNLHRRRVICGKRGLLGQQCAKRRSRSVRRLRSSRSPTRWACIPAALSQRLPPLPE